MALVTDYPVEAARDAAVRLDGSERDYENIMLLVGEARFVLLGEASHGTHEFYRSRCEITKRLIRELGFNAVAVEADWPDAYRINRYVRGDSYDEEATQALGDFRRFPTWMWRNADVLDFVGWLRAFNDRHRKREPKVGFYGLDLYSLSRSIHAVLKYLEGVDPEAARRARTRYQCFEEFGGEGERYGYSTTSSQAETCEDAVVEQLTELHRHAADYVRRDGQESADEFFFAEQNARLVKNAEEYYRSMFRGRGSSWNLRDKHMTETLHALVGHLKMEIKNPKVVVWAHNSHLGDARATQMGRGGEWNIGQLIRERYHRDAVLIGYTTYSGTVTAAADWDMPAERKQVRPALEGSYERLFHETEFDRFLLPLKQPSIVQALEGPLLERAIGVVYRPQTERLSHYFQAWLPRQFDAVIHFDETRAVEPLDRTSDWERGELPETFPTGL